MPDLVGLMTATFLDAAHLLGRIVIVLSSNDNCKFFRVKTQFRFHRTGSVGIDDVTSYP